MREQDLAVKAQFNLKFVVKNKKVGFQMHTEMLSMPLNEILAQVFPVIKLKGWFLKSR